MYEYRVNNKNYDVPYDKLEVFLEKYPNAVLLTDLAEIKKQDFVVDGVVYSVSPGEFEGFKRRFGHKIQTPEMYAEQQAAIKEQKRQAKLLEGDEFTLTSWQGFTDWWSIDKEKGETQEENTWVETLFGKNQLSDLFGDFGRAVEKGWAQGKDVSELGLLFNVKDRPLTEEEQKTIFDAVERQSNLGVSDEMLVYMSSVPSSKNGTFNMMNAVSGMSPSLIFETFTSSIVSMAAALTETEGLEWALKGGVTGAAVGFGTGAAIGAFTGPGALATGGIGALRGLAGGVMGGLGGVLEATGKVGELIRKEMDALGMEFNYENYQKFAKENPDILEDISAKAITKGVTVGAIEGLFGAIAMPGAGTLLKVGGTAAKTLSKPLVRTGIAFGLEGTGGALGEYYSQKAIGEEANIKELMLEATGGGPVTAYSVYNQIKNPATYTINGKTYSGKNRNKGRDAVWNVLSNKNLTDKEIVAADIQVENDPVLEAEINARTKAYEILARLPKDTRKYVTVDGKKIKNENYGKDLISLEDREKLLELEVALEEGQNKKATLVEVGGKLISLLDLKQQIKDIYGKYEGKTKQDLRVGDVKTAVDVRRDLLADTEQTKSDQEAAGLDYQNFDFTEQFEDAFFEKHLADLGLDPGSMTEQQLLDMRDELFLGKKNKKGKRIGGAKGVEGMNFADGTLFVDKQRAVETRTYKSVNSHEFLHNVVDNRFESLSIDKRKTLLKDFKKVLKSKLSKKNYNNIVNRLKRNGEDLETSTEWFTYLSDEIQNTKNFKEKSKGFLNSLLPFLNKNVNEHTEYKNLDFENADNVYEFLKDYATNVEGRKKLKAKARDTGAARFSRSKAVDAVNKMEQGAETKAEFQKPGIFNNIYNSIRKEGGAINNYVKTLGLSKEKFQETIDSLSDRLISYDPAAERKTDSKEPITIGEFLMSNIGFAKLDAAKELAIEGKKEGKTTRIDAAKKTKEGETTFDIEDTDTSIQEVLEEEDMSLTGIAKREAKKAKAKKKRYSKLRQELGFETDGDTYNTVLDAARKSLLLAYGKTLKITNAKARVDKIVELIKKEYNSLNSDLFKPLKNFLGTKEYLINLKKFREVIVESIPTADLVQMEKFVPDNEKIFTTFVRKLTAKAQVQDAVDKNLLPKDALNTIDKGEAVNLYQKVMPSPDEFIGFANQPAINPDTGAKSGLKGTRKDGFAKRIAESLILDAVMEVRQEAEVQKTLTEDLNV